METDYISRAAGLATSSSPRWMVKDAVDDMHQALDRLVIYNKYFADGVGGEA